MKIGNDTIKKFIACSAGSAVALYTGAFGYISAITDPSTLLIGSAIVGGFCVIASMILESL